MFPNFTAALEKYKDEMRYNSFWRYAKAQRLPKIITWIVQRPELAQALAADAVLLASQGKERPIVAQEGGDAER